jgi:beta-galactosidase
MNLRLRKMKKFLLLFIMGLTIVSQFVYGQVVTRKIINFDEGWRFSLEDNQDAFEARFVDKNWRILNLPHDWSVEGTVTRDAAAGGSGGYYPAGTGWYRKHFNITKSDLNRNNLILFDGVYMNSDVWINGKHLGNYPFGYNSFYYDLDPFLKTGENVIAVKVDNSKQPNSRWYSGSGIYRHVWLIRTNPLHIAQWGVYVTTPVIDENRSTVAINIKIDNTSRSGEKAELVSYVLDDKGVNVGQVETAFHIQSGQELILDQQITVPSPKVWSVDTPVMYSLVTKILVDGKPVDELTTPFGIRSIRYDVDDGFFLNGQNIKMNGVCLHHDGGCVGAAVPVRVWERRLQVLKDMGCNAIRTAHNPVDPEFLDLCDKMGFLVMDEVFDEWKIGKVKFGYNNYFDEWAEKDVISFIHRDRNHPSVVMWSAGNEIREQPAEGGEKVLQKMLYMFHSEDPTRPVTVGCDNIAADDHPARMEFLNLLDIVGYNYADRWHERRELFYSIDRHDHPEWKMTGTESVSIGGLRSDYNFERDSTRIFSNYNTRMIRAEQLWKFVATRPYVIGDFMWTGIDYLGESRWPSKHASSGVIDICGFPKDGYYFYQSQWTEEPVLHLFPHWNWEGMEGSVIPVLAYTNCDAVELFVNGKSYGEKRLEFPRQGNSGSWMRYDLPQKFATTADLHLSWDVPYEPGVVKAVGKRNGEVVCTKVIETTGKPAAIQLITDADQINADNQDVAHVRVEIVDLKGNIVPTANNMISYKISGSGELLGLDNGDPRDHELYRSGKRKVFNGLGLAIVQAGKTPGKITLTALSDGMEDVTVDIKVLKK